MNRSSTLLFATAAAVSLALGPAVPGPALAASVHMRPWLDHSLSARARAVALVAQLTLDEKITELHGIQDSDHVRYVPGVPRLGIPPLRITNGPAGVGPGDDPHQQAATALPAPISLAASFDPALAWEYGNVTGAETRDLAHSLLEGPDINIARVPVNGRTFEGYGEDPYLVGQLAAADIRGVQHNGIIAEVKHFFANNQEQNRFAVNEVIDDRTAHEIYLPQFEAAVRQGHAGSVMCAYPKVNGTFDCESPRLLQTVLRDQWGFQGFVQSDFGAAHSTVPSAEAGMDLEMPTGVHYDAAMKQAVLSGQIPEQAIDTLVVRRLTVMIEFGLFDRALASSPIPVARDGAFARAAAEQGTVLLRNEGNQLPLSASVRSVAVVGPYAGAAKTGGGGSSHVDPLYTVSPVAGIQQRVPGATVTYDSGADPASAAALAARSDVAIVMVGDSETEGSDRPGLALAGNQDQLVEAVAAANPHTVVVVKSGAPVLMPWVHQVPAIVESWYPGEEDGNAVAAVLFGDVNPSGKLPITFPAASGDVPASTPQQYPGVNGTAVYSEGLDVGYRWYDARHITPLFPFGYGLSYTSFRLGHLSVSPVPGSAGGQVTVSVDVTNTGARAGADVAQVYVTEPASAGEPPVQLKGFQKVMLRPHQTRRVTVRLDARAFSVWDTAAQAWTVVPGVHQVRVGGSSVDLPLHTPVVVRRVGAHR
jgi:beta-glucosidase